MPCKRGKIDAEELVHSLQILTIQRYNSDSTHKMRNIAVLLLNLNLNTIESFKTTFLHSTAIISKRIQSQTQVYTDSQRFFRTSPLTMTYTAWTCDGSSNTELIQHLHAAGIVKHQEVFQALAAVDRKNYIKDIKNAYIDAPQSIGKGQTISAPHMHAHALEEILPRLIDVSKNSKDREGEMKILDVGCGSGYLTACFGRLIDVLGCCHGKVFGIDVIPQLVELSTNNIMKQDKDLILSNKVTLARADGWNGLAEQAPYDAIHVGAAAESFPSNLMMQLKVNGTMILPVGPDGGVQTLYKVEKLRESHQYNVKDFRIEKILGVRYVPLVKTKDW